MRSSLSGMTSPILWQSLDKTVTLLDIPQTITAAQSCSRLAGHHLLSSTPLQFPFPSHEPKSASTKEGAGNDEVDPSLHAQYQNVLSHALDELSLRHKGKYCLPRPYVLECPPRTKKRKAESDLSVAGHSTDTLSLEELSSIRITDLVPSASNSNDTPPLAFGHASKPEEIHFANDSAEACTLHMMHPSTSKTYKFCIPPGSAFVVGDCSRAREFHAQVRNHAQELDTRKEFDFILLDPPWPNRSVRRTHKTTGSTYAISPSLGHLQDMLLRMDLDMLMADGCYVGIWITHKPAVRELVLGTNGLFASWGFTLVEEWIWLKLTSEGEPVTLLTSTSKRPYEVLLLGKKQNLSLNSPESNACETRRRVILAVPDLHSRKPCLKSLVDSILTGRSTYRALEIFSRHLVSGWWSWGDQCIKYNWEACWGPISADEGPV